MPNSKNNIHGMCGTPIYWCWSAMIQRCTNPKNPVYHLYGGRGIQVDPRWLIFLNFYADMNPRPHGLTLERRDNDGNYIKNNCYWATQKRQSRNTRWNQFVEFNGERLCVSEWAERLGMTPNSLTLRLKRWPLERALTESVGSNKLLYTINETTKTLGEWCHEYGVDYATMYHRIIYHSEPILSALTRPIRDCGR